MAKPVPTARCAGFPPVPSTRGGFPLRVRRTAAGRSGELGQDVAHIAERGVHTVDAGDGERDQDDLIDAGLVVGAEPAATSPGLPYRETRSSTSSRADPTGSDT
ncbi:hypothetical protein GCM10010259_24620 [Streptomyces daghestanicus]|jgi:hypothetical protein|uniref:Uncharacterized protein n=1 Tax=Streptomyces daghestanicus TaxID=66885 RepID=A0ABQ3QA77_9ACTN|nr:hypothetical protein GCM10010240_00410 [Streptomyces griseoviridis]GGU33269.1 hypothetical protein GCM10010259_24620 [Streptomyces daghestanicus]GHI34170.1 hypothetical protein Sdagh_59000 [Streptomyces daghestanicus]